MFLVEMVDLVVNVGGLCLEKDCNASSFTSLAAAFSTQGYYVQSDLLDYLTLSLFGHWAALIYVFAAMGGLVSMALGQPPRLWIWFFMGPAVYAWLLDSRVESYGVRWMSGELQMEQSEVWKIAEPGMVNTDVYHRKIVEGENLGISRDNRPQVPAKVSLAFYWFDDLVSATVRRLVAWVGPHRQSKNLSTSAAIDTNINPNLVDAIDQDYARGEDISNNGPITSPPSSAPGDWKAKQLNILTNLKWEMLHNLTNARLQSPDIRDAFVSFMASECGDLTQASLNEAAFIDAAHSKGIYYPVTVFQQANLQSSLDQLDEEPLIRNLYGLSIPMPYSLKTVLAKEGEGSFKSSVQTAVNACPSTTGPVSTNETIIEDLSAMDEIRCDAYLDILMYLFRFETGHIYYHAVQSIPVWQYDGTTETDPVTLDPTQSFDDKESIFLGTLLYGWNIRPLIRQNNTPAALDYNATFRTIPELREFVFNLIFAHLVRNEMANAPQITDPRYSSSENGKSYVEAYQRVQGAAGKYGEIYTWAKMVPYMQGVLLYFLAVAYPFACLFVVIPGWHKIIFTWMSFWLWAKLWDVGFAMATMVERTIWAMIGNTDQAAHAFARIVEMGNIAPLDMSVSCNGTGTESGIAQVLITGDLDTGGSPAFRQAHYQLFDRALMMASNLDLDLDNSYYLYIMAALYFAVPAVTGQLVLGAKSGASSMLGTAIGGTSQEAGRTAGSGLGSQALTQMRSGMAAAQQEAYAKDMRQSGLADQAISHGNASRDASNAQSALSAMSQGVGAAKDQISNRSQSFSHALAAGITSGVEGSRVVHAVMSQGGRAVAGNHAAARAAGTSGSSPIPGADGGNAAGAAMQAGNGSSGPDSQGGSATSGAAPKGGGVGGGSKKGVSGGSAAAKGVVASAIGGGLGFLSGGIPGAVSGMAAGASMAAGGGSGGGDGSSGGGSSDSSSSAAGSSSSPGGSVGGRASSGGSKGISIPFLSSLVGGGTSSGTTGVNPPKLGGESEKGGFMQQHGDNPGNPGSPSVVQTPTADSGTTRPNNVSPASPRSGQRVGGGLRNAASDTAGALNKNFRSASQGAGEVLSKVAENEMQQQKLGDLSNATMIGAGLNVGQFKAGSESTGYEMAGQRRGSQAEFSARSAQWNMQNKMANQLSGASVALGAYAGSFAPGDKPADMMGMAMSGMLNGGRGGDVRAKAMHFEPGQRGGFFGMANQRAGELDRKFGAQAMGSLYQSYTPFQAVMQGLGSFGEHVAGVGGALNKNLHAGSMDGNQNFVNTGGAKYGTGSSNAVGGSGPGLFATGSKSGPNVSSGPSQSGSSAPSAAQPAQPPKGSGNSK